MKIKTAAFRSVATALTAATTVAGTFTSDFSNPAQTGITLIGGTRANGDPYPAIANGVLAITYAENSLNGAVVFDNLDAGKAIESFTLSFKLRIGGGTSTPADGMSLFFGPDVPTAPFGEDGPADTTSLVIAIDTYDNGNSEGPSIDVRYGGAVVASAAYSVGNILSETFAPVTLQLNANGTVNFNYKGVQVFTNLFVPGFKPTAGQFAIGARTGGLNANHWVDDLTLTTKQASAPVGPTVLKSPTSVTAAERSDVTFSALPAGTPPFTLQWLKDNVVVPEATNLTYSLKSVPASLSGTKYSLRFTNDQGAITTDPATLTVTPDTAAPTLVSVKGSESFNTVLVTFSEPVGAGTTGNYSLGGLAISGVTQISPTQVLLATGTQTPGARYTLTVTGIQDTATTPNTIAAATAREFGAFVLAKGFLKFEAWANLAGVNVQQLLDDPRYQAGTPDQVGFISPFDSRSIYPADDHENYGARISGFVTPTTAGDYRFFVRSDDAGELWLSSNSSPANLGKIAEEANCCDAFHDPEAPETSEPIALKANTSYAVQFLYKEGGGGDYGQVAWRLEGDTTLAANLLPIPGQFLSTYADPDAAVIAITSAPASKTAAENTTTTFTAAGTGVPAPLVVQWQRAEPGSATFTDIPGAVGKTYTTPVLKQATDDGAKFRATFLVPGGSSNSVAATLTVNIDSTAPTIANAVAADNLKGVTLTFSEPVIETTAKVAANYTIAGLTVGSATVVNTTTVRLVTSAQTEGQTYTVAVLNVKDSAGNPIVAGANTRSFKAPVILPGILKFEAFTGISGNTPADLRASAKYPSQPDEVRLLPAFEGPNGYADNYGARVKGFVTPATTGDYVFFMASDDGGELYLSTDDTETAKKLIAVEPVYGNPREWTGDSGGRRTDAAKVDPAQITANVSLPVRLVSGQRYYTELIYKEGGGGDHGAVKFQLASSADPENGSPASVGSTLSTAIDPDVLAKLTLPTDVSSAVGSGGARGFKVRLNQANQIGGTGLPTFVFRAEQQLAGLVDTNAADLTLFTDGVLNVSSVINWNQDVGQLGTGNAGSGVEIGSFTSATPPANADQPIPGIPGIGSAVGDDANPRRTDNIAAEIISYVEFPSPGIYFMGVNSDDGFRVTVGDQPPAANGAVVATSGGVTKSFYAASGGAESGGAFRALTKPFVGKLVLTVPAIADRALDNAAAIAGNIAVIDRGVNTFSAKVQFAKDAGAIGAIIVNSRDPDSADGKFPIVMGGAFVDFPAVMISKPQGAELKALIAAGPTTGGVTPDPSPGLGNFNGGRGATDSIFAFNVAQAGLYPLRLVWFEGGGGANCEWFTVKADGTKVLLNDTANGGLAGYRTRTFVSVVPEITASVQGADLVLTFKGKLQSSTALGTPFTDEAAASPHHLPLGSAAGKKFYRAAR